VGVLGGDCASSTLFAFRLQRLKKKPAICMNIQANIKGQFVSKVVKMLLYQLQNVLVIT
jgi:hypothetical protein